MSGIIIDRRTVLAGLGGGLLTTACAATPRLVTPRITMPVDAGARAVPDLVNLATFDRRLRFDIHYATPNNFLRRRLYPVARALAQRPVAEALRRVQTRAEAEGYGLLIHDAYRPWRITLQMWEGTSGEAREYVANPATGSRHNRGCAVDLTLHRRGVAVEMPSAYDDLTARARRDNMNTTPTAIANRALLEGIMVAEGFIPLPSEWWHFDWRDWQQYPIMDQPLR